MSSKAETRADYTCPECAVAECGLCGAFYYSGAEEHQCHVASEVPQENAEVVRAKLAAMTDKLDNLIKQWQYQAAKGGYWYEQRAWGDLILSQCATEVAAIIRGKP